MEDRLIQEWLLPDNGYIADAGDSYGYDFGSGDSYGRGYGNGESDGRGYSHGNGSGSGFSPGSSTRTGCGCDSGNGKLKSYNKQTVFMIDDLPTIVTNIRGNFAKGFIIREDFTLSECYIVKEQGLFAHGRTLHEAIQSLQEKIYDELSEEERIAKFKDEFKDFAKKYPAKDLFVWHHILTGSCLFGRQEFCRGRGIDIEKDAFTIFEFIELTKDAYNGHIVERLLC